MIHIIDFLSEYPHFAVPLSTYGLSVALAFFSNRTFGAVVRTDIIRAGTNLCLVACGLLATAAFDKASQLNRTYAAKMPGAIVAYGAVFVCLYFLAYRLQRYANRAMRTSAARPTFRMIVAVAIAHSAGALAVNLSWVLP